MEESSGHWLWWLVGAAALAGVWFFLRGRKQGIQADETRPRLDFADMVAWFKTPENTRKLSENPNLEPVIKRGPVSGGWLISLALYNRKTGQAETMRTIKTFALDEAAARQFGNKDMIVLE